VAEFFVASEEAEATFIKVSALHLKADINRRLGDVC